MDRRNNRIVLIFALAALTVSVLPVIPVGEVLAPEHSASASRVASEAPALGPVLVVDAPPVSPVADASTIEKLRHLFSH